MKRIHYLFITFCLIITNAIFAQVNTAADKAFKPNWRLVFYDEFDSLGMNPQKWSNSFPWGRWTHGLHYNTNGQNLLYNGTRLNIKTDDDSLTVLMDSWDSIGNYTPYPKHFDYTSGMIFSKRSFKYGYFESKVKVAATKGLNAAFWLYGFNDCEIDAFEIQGSTPNNAQMTLHWKDPDSVTNSRQSIYHSYSIDSNFSQKEYVFGVKWKQNELVWYVDNNEVVEDFFTRIVRSRHIPTVDMNAIFTCEVGTMDGNPDSTSVFPSYYNIEYFRAYNDDTVPPPFITGQFYLSMSFFSSLAITPAMLIVNDFYHTYPAGFKVEVLNGNNYSVNGNVITPLNNTVTSLNVAVRVNDGIEKSPVYNLVIHVPDANSIQENNLTEKLLLFPDPVDDFLKISFVSGGDEIKSIDIFDTKGIHYIYSTMNNQQGIDVSRLEKGMYFVAITTIKKKTVLKFVKN